MGFAKNIAAAGLYFIKEYFNDRLGKQFNIKFENFFNSIKECYNLLKNNDSISVIEKAIDDNKKSLFSIIDKCIVLFGGLIFFMVYLGDIWQGFILWITLVGVWFIIKMFDISNDWIMDLYAICASAFWGGSILYFCIFFIIACFEYWSIYVFIFVSIICLLAYNIIIDVAKKLKYCGLLGEVLSLCFIPIILFLFGIMDVYCKDSLNMDMINRYIDNILQCNYSIVAMFINYIFICVIVIKEIFRLDICDYVVNHDISIVILQIFFLALMFINYTNRVPWTKKLILKYKK